jgi:hypothetical protein
MRFNNRALIVSVLTLAICVCSLVAFYSLSLLRGTGGAPPPEASEPTAGLAATDLPPPITVTELPASTPQPAINEARRLTLEFPPTIRAGDSDIVRLTLEVDELGNITPTAQFEEHVVTGEIVKIPNLYESHHVVAESRFDIAGLEVRPAELISIPLTPGQSATFSWSIRPPDTGLYRGTIWLYLRFVDKLNGGESQITVSAQLVEIESVNLLGFSGSFARTTGLIGSVIGTIIGIPFFEDIVKYVYRRIRKA